MLIVIISINIVFIFLFIRIVIASISISISIATKSNLASGHITERREAAETPTLPMSPGISAPAPPPPVPPAAGASVSLGFGKLSVVWIKLVELLEDSLKTIERAEDRSGFSLQNATLLGAARQPSPGTSLPVT